MRDYAFEKKWKKLLTPEIIALLTKIHEYRGSQNLYVESKPVCPNEARQTGCRTQNSNRIGYLYICRAVKTTCKKKQPQEQRRERNRDTEMFSILYTNKPYFT